MRLPDIAVPLATYSGRNEYKPPHPAGELADRDGSCLARAIRGRRTERYKSGPDYVAKVQAVVSALPKLIETNTSTEYWRRS